MFRSSTIIGELSPNVAKFIFVLKHSVELRRRHAVVWQHVMEWCGSLMMVED